MNSTQVVSDEDGVAVIVRQNFINKGVQLPVLPNRLILNACQSRWFERATFPMHQIQPVSQGGLASRTEVTVLMWTVEGVTSELIGVDGIKMDGHCANAKG